jgi:hypothetical protein
MTALLNALAAWTNIGSNLLNGNTRALPSIDAERSEELITGYDNATAPCDQRSPQPE